MSYSMIQTESLLSAREESSQNGNSLPHRNGFSTRAPARKRTRSRISNADGHTKNFPFIVHSHLCWDWVWQRPQQFLSRLSKRHKILFVETVAPDPQLVVPTARFRVEENFPNITILRIQFPSFCWNDGHYVDNMRRLLVREALAGPLAGQFENPVQWFYDPMAVEAFLGFMNERANVYDCMDELSKFRGAPPEILFREKEMLAAADVVFCGGRKLWESKSKSNDNCHFYGCGVDVEHFGKARTVETGLPADVATLSKPVLGYFGVVDERMDYELIAKLADSNPGWSVVFVGPTAKVDPNALPRRPNLHWLGQRAYTQLPAYCKAFDVCLMPFALNEATEFINPTKALEYMATGRMIVSSAVPDVVRNFGDVVRVANSHDEFIALCQKALAKPEEKLIERGLKMAERNSWDSIVAKLEAHIQEALEKKHAVNGKKSPGAAHSRNGHAKMETVNA
jgi:glycosyltransferase involved in cell wall biosynthesis